MKIIQRQTEVKIIEALSDVQEDPAHWVAVYFAFSQLIDHYQSEYQIKIAVNLINDLVGESQGNIFLYDDNSIYVVVHGASKALIDKMVFQLRYLFMDDPLAYTEDGEENPDFAMVYDLERTFDDFMSHCKGRLTAKIKGSGGRAGAGAVSKPGEAPKAQPGGALPKVKEDKANEPLKLTQEAAKPSTKPSGKSDGKSKLFTAVDLSHIERDLSNADLSKVLRRQPICAAVPNTMVRRVFDELYINIAHLRQVLGKDVDLLSNKWLFKYLTEILDDRMLHLLQRAPTRYMDNPISLNLNVPTLLSNRFAEFDASIKPAVKVSIVIEIQLADVFADMAGFLLAKDTVQKLGYRVCLDGVTNLSFLQIDRERLGFDLLKLQWNADFEEDAKSKESKDIAAAIKRCGVNRVILTRCDNREAVDYGQALGISLFQGRYLDKLMNPQSTIEN